MAWTFISDIGRYQQAAGELLSSQPVRHTVFLTVLATLSRLGPDAFGAWPPLLGWWSDGADVRAAVLQTPPYPMQVTALPWPSADELAAELADRAPALAAVSGAEPEASAFARAWSLVSGKQVEVRQRLRLYQLGQLSAPDPWPPGAARVATVADAAIASSWLAAFSAETGEGGAPDGLLDARLRAGRLLLWESGGEPVSMAGVNEVVGAVARVGGVYTPPGQRGRGYAGAVTAKISARCLADGAQSVILITDLANPASNSVYLRLGYVPVADRVVLNFTDKSC